MTFSRTAWARSSLIALVLALLALAADARAADEPGMESALDEPGIGSQSTPAVREAPSGPPATDATRFWLRLGAGASSLVVDPDVDTGIAGVVALGLRVYGRFSLEAQVAAAYNPFGGELGASGNIAFGGGSISLVPQFELTAPGSAIGVLLDAGLGFYYTAPMLQDDSWSLGFSWGVGLEWRVLSWLAIGVRARYHLFNVTVISGPELVDVKSIQRIGLIDRLEVPGYVAFSY